MPRASPSIDILDHELDRNEAHLLRIRPFRMGSPAGEKGRTVDREDQVSVTISKGFYLGKYSVTQAEYKAVMGTTPWAGKVFVKKRDDYPANYVDWNDATEFCRKLTARESQAGRLPQGYVYALPTEAQWEYACRAGTTTAYSFGDDVGNLRDYAWWGGVFDDKAKMERYAHRVGQKRRPPDQTVMDSPRIMPRETTLWLVLIGSLSFLLVEHYQSVRGPK